MATSNLKLGVPSNPFDDVFSAGRDSTLSRPSLLRGFEPHKNFTQACPPDQYKQGEKCMICSEGFSSLLKKSKNCQFCGKCVCKECSRHSRRDPANAEVALRVCDLCHQQILYKRIVEAFMIKKQNIDVLKYDITEECNQKKNELHKKQITDQEVNKQIEMQRHKYERVLDDRKQRVAMQKERYNKGLVEGSTLKDKISKLNEDIKSQEEEISNEKQTSTLRVKETEHSRLQNKYETISNDIDKHKLQQQFEMSTDATEDIQTKDQKQKMIEQQNFRATIINLNDLNLSLNYQSTLNGNSLKRKIPNKPSSRQKKNQKVSEGCCQSGGGDSKCVIY